MYALMNVKTTHYVGYTDLCEFGYEKGLIF